MGRVDEPACSPSPPWRGGLPQIFGPRELRPLPGLDPQRPKPEVRDSRHGRKRAERGPAGSGRADEEGRSALRASEEFGDRVKARSPSLLRLA